MMTNDHVAIRSGATETLTSTPKCGEPVNSATSAPSAEPSATHPRPSDHK